MNLRILYIYRPEDTDYRDQTYTPDEFALKHAVPFISKADHDSILEAEREKVRQLCDFIENWGQGSLSQMRRLSVQLLAKYRGEK